MRREKALSVKSALAQELLLKPRNLVRTFAAVETLNDRRYRGLAEVVNGVGTAKINGTLGVRFLLEEEMDVDVGPLARDFDVPEAEITTEHVGRINALAADVNTRARVRPAHPCLSVGHPKVTAGTFGCLVEDEDGWYILSNNHVLANCNNCGEGDEVIQPGRADYGDVNNDVIAHLDRYVPIDYEGFNKVDAAVAKVVSRDAVDPEIPGVGEVGSTAPPLVDRAVVKHGRTTGLTNGRITSNDIDIKVYYDREPVLFEDQVEIRGDAGDFSAGGDSGSLVVDRDTGDAVGLLFAGAVNGPTFANHINLALTALGVGLVCQSAR